ncbi:putative transcription factor OFP family [Helianthus anomalus]
MHKNGGCRCWVLKIQPNKTTKKKLPHRKPKKIECFSSTTHNYYYDWRSSDDEDDTSDETTLFSSRSFRSESSGSFHKNRAYRKPEKNNGKLVKDRIAVAKKSSNPYEDFRVSMVEMIVEKQIFRGEELTNLFECFISLNFDCNHPKTVEDFFRERSPGSSKICCPAGVSEIIRLGDRNKRYGGDGGGDDGADGGGAVVVVVRCG